jgi:Ca-activated chloride channel family protein
MQSIFSQTSPLQQAQLDIEIETPIAKTQLTQTFVNQTNDIIEAVYSFPIPRQAVIMQVTVTINGEVFNGQIKPVTEAEECYEEGIEEGKRSVLIRDIGDGQHELRAGNLAPEDSLVIEITIAQLMQAQSGGYRYFLPTVIAPKYGHAKDLRDVSHQHSLLASYPFSASLKVAGDPAVICLSHGLQKQDKRYLFEGALDQDIVLTVASNFNQPYVIQSLQGGYPCGLAVLPPQESGKSAAIASIVLLIDCSGSMTGLSMQQTRDGLSALLTDLPENSEVSLMCFGSDVMHVTNKPLTINPKNRKVLHEYVSNLQADMGGTELWNALSAAQNQCKKHKKTPEIILLTDGQVWDNDDFFNAVNADSNEHCRINTIGIGSAVSEGIVIRLAEATCGQWMLVHPNEPMDERICHFIGQVSAPRIAGLWETENTQWSALPSSSSEVHGATGFVVYCEEAKAHDIALNNVVLPKTILTNELGLALQKLAGQQQVHALNETDATALSLKLGLVNRHTSFVMVNEQSVVNADGLPTLAVVPQMVVGAASLNANLRYNYLDSDIINFAHDTSIDCHEMPTLFLRREKEHDVLHESEEIEEAKNSSMTGLFKRLFSRNSSEHALLIKVDKKLSRTVLENNIPTLEQLIKWGLDITLAKLIKEYCMQHGIGEQSGFIAKFLLRLNDESDILSVASIDILQNKIDELRYENLVLFNGFIDKLNKLEVKQLGKLA